MHSESETAQDNRDASSNHSTDAAHFFFMECHRTAHDAQFILDALPNVDVPAVEQTIIKLQAVQSVLLNLNDPFTAEGEKQAMLDYVQSLLSPLEAHLSQLEDNNRNHGPQLHYSGSRGAPSYILDLNRAVQLHNLGNSWESIAKSMGVGRTTLYTRLKEAGLSSARPEHSDISDDDLDVIIAEIGQDHPFIGSIVMQGHLESRGIHVPRLRVQESLRRVDAMGVMLRWRRIIRRRVYKVRGSNALWHMDGNEKLKPWGFYVHGCIDGHSRLIIYLRCCLNKRASTVSGIFLQAVGIFGWPSRVRGDFGTENNDVERLMKEHWGDAHRAYLRGRSLHNVQIERLWRDVRKDSLEAFRQVFMHLEEREILDMENATHRSCLFLVYRNRIQKSLDRTRDAWNHHCLRTEKNKTPIAIFELSREAAITGGYWTGDAGDASNSVDDDYGVDGDAPAPPARELGQDPLDAADEPNQDDLRNSGIEVNSSEEVEAVRTQLGDFDCDRDDENWGIEVFHDALRRLGQL